MNVISNEDLTRARKRAQQRRLVNTMGILDAFSVEVRNRLDAKPIVGNAIAQLYLTFEEVYKDWQRDFPEDLAKLGPHINAWFAHEIVERSK
jgi:hypothetical protein